MNGIGQNRKPLPLRPSQDGMYGAPSGAYPSQPQSPPPRSIPSAQSYRVAAPLQSPTGRAVLEGYRKDIINNFEGEKPRYNPMNQSRPQSSMLLNTNDPIQMHLLVETAMEDSKEFELLSQEEVDDLKKQCVSLTQRIEQTRQNLAIQSKYRDAAISMSKLYGPSEKGGHDKKGVRRSLLGNRSSNSESVKEADLERINSERKCEELAQELWNLEKRLIEPQRRLLQHTAGILQLTHKGPSRVQKSNGISQPGIPGSPESMYTYSNTRSSVDPIEEDLFDDRSLYHPHDRMDTFNIGGRRESIEAQGRTSSRSPAKSKDQSLELAKAKEQAEQYMKTVYKTERKLEDLNGRLREVLIKADPQGGRSYRPPPQPSSDEKSLQPENLLVSLDYLEQGIGAIDEAHRNTLNKQKDSDIAMEQTIEQLNREVRALLLPFDPTVAMPPQLTGKSLKEQLLYFQNSIGVVEDELQRAASVSSQTKEYESRQDNLEQVETVLTGLWDLIQSGEEDIRRRKQQRRQTRQANLDLGEESDSDDEIMDGYVEPFSLQAFSTKVQRLFTQATGLKDQKKVLQRQIKQQRELNNKSDGERDAKLSQAEEDLQKARAALAQAETNVKKRDSADAAALAAMETKLLSRNDEIMRLEEEVQELKDDSGIRTAEIQGKLTEAEKRINELETELAEAGTLREAIASKEDDIESKNMEIARLQTEVTIARAELDGAYGSRAERAKEMAANAASNPAIVSQIDQLKRELGETIDEYEVLTKQSIEWEKEREGMEREIDRLREEKESLELKLGDEQVRWLGMKSPGGPNGSSGPETPGAGSTSTAVLKNEFKKMMRDTRAEHSKALRNEQAERKRLEDEIRALKKIQGPKKSNLSQSIASP